MRWAQTVKNNSQKALQPKKVSLPVRGDVRQFSEAWKPPVKAELPEEVIMASTVLHPDHTRLIPKHLRMLTKMTGRTPLEHAAYTAPRRAWQQTILLTNTMLQFETADELYDRVHMLHHKHVMPNLDRVIEADDALFAKMKLQVEEQMELRKQGKPTWGGVFRMNEALLRRRRDRGEKILTNESIFDQALQTMTLHDIYRGKSGELIDGILKPVLREGIIVEGCKLLPEHESGNHVFLIHGAPGTGKSVAWPRFKKELKDLGVPWPEVLKVNSDWYRPLLLEFGALSELHRPYYEHLTNDELCSMTLVLFDKYINRVGEPNPHAVIEHPFASEQMVHNTIRSNVAENPRDTKMKMVFFIVPPEVNVERIHHRAENGNPDSGLGTGRHVTVETTLDRYKMALEEFWIAVRMGWQGDNPFVFEIIDKNIPLAPGVVCPTIARGNFSSRTLEVLDVEGAMRMYYYGSIRSSATSLDNLYGTVRQPKECLMGLLDLVDLMNTTRFIDPETQTVYAELEGRKLTVVNAEMLEQKMENPYYAAAFNYLSKGKNISHTERLQRERDTAEAQGKSV